MRTRQLFLAVLVFGVALHIGAAPLNLNLNQPGPDLYGTFLTVDYSDVSPVGSPGTRYDLQVVSGSPRYLTEADGTRVTISSPRSFVLDAILDQNHVLQPGSSFTISGKVGTAPAATLLQGVLTDFGYSASTVIEFTFDATAGTWQNLFGDNGGIIMGTSWNGNWGTPAVWANGDGYADVGHVPDAGSAMALFGLASAGICLFRGRIQKRR